LLIYSVLSDVDVTTRHDTDPERLDMNAITGSLWWCQ